MTNYQGSITVLNASYEPHAHVDFPRAVRMLMRKVAVVVEGDETRRIGPHPWPKVLMLVRYVYESWLDKPAKWHRGGLFIRDKHKCAYCGKKAQSIDHITPQVEGGLWSWENCVAACFDCNGKKGRRSLAASGMTLRYAKPYVPTVRQIRELAKAA